MNTLASNRPPMDQTIPYTLRLVWCPTLTIFTFTFFFLISIWAIYVFTLIYGGIDVNSKTYSVLAPFPATLQQFGAINPSLIRDGQVWRLLTAAFLHIDLLHITMNSISILFFMSRLEKCYNFRYMMGLALASALAGIYRNLYRKYYINYFLGSEYIECRSIDCHIRMLWRFDCLYDHQLENSRQDPITAMLRNRNYFIHINIYEFGHQRSGFGWTYGRISWRVSLRIGYLSGN